MCKIIQVKVKYHQIKIFIRLKILDFILITLKFEDSNQNNLNKLIDLYK